MTDENQIYSLYHIELKYDKVETAEEYWVIADSIRSAIAHFTDRKKVNDLSLSCTPIATGDKIGIQVEFLEYASKKEGAK